MRGRAVLVGWETHWGHPGLRVCQEPRWGHQKRETARSDPVPVPKGHLHKEERSLVVGHQTALGRKKKDFGGEKDCLPGCGNFRRGIFTMGLSRRGRVTAENETGPTARCQHLL